MTNSTDDYLRFNEPPVNPDDEDEDSDKLDTCLNCGGPVVWRGERFWCGRCKVFI